MCTTCRALKLMNVTTLFQYNQELDSDEQSKVSVGFLVLAFLVPVYQMACCPDHQDGGNFQLCAMNIHLRPVVSSHFHHTAGLTNQPTSDCLCTV